MIYLGTSGYSYDDWKGRWYPPSLPRAKMLEYYAERFNAVEINSTFYRIPPPRMMDSLVQKAGKRLIFAIKVSQQITHQSDLSEATITAFLRSIEPVAKADRLGALLLQFPFRFHWTPENGKYLERAVHLLRGFPLVVENRHDSWDQRSAMDFFKERKISRCLIDLPRLRGLPAPSTVLTGPLAYFRFHGRNGTHWFDSENASDPYDYSYTTRTLKSWIEPVRNAERKAETAFVFFNNHVNGQAPANAYTFAELLGMPALIEPYRDLFGP